MASEKGHLDCMRFLIDNGAEVAPMMAWDMDLEDIVDIDDVVEIEDGDSKLDILATAAFTLDNSVRSRADIEDAEVPDDLREFWAAKKHLILSEDGTKIDFGSYWDLRGKATDAFVTSLLSSKVTLINLAGCYTLTAEAFKAIGANCPALTELYVKGCNNLTSEAIQAIAANCPSLTELHIQGCPNVTSEAIKAIAENCLALIELHVGHCPNLTDEPIMVIAANCPALTSLNVQDCINLTKIPGNCPTLTSLDVQDCINLTDEAIDNITKDCPLLNYLNALFCSFTALPDDIGDRLPNLEYLDLQNNKLTSLPQSIAKLTKLEELNLEQNPLQDPPYEIAVKGLDAIKAYFEELEKGFSISKLLKVNIIGDGMAGKTSLRNALAGRENPREKLRTIHAEMEEVPLNADLVLNIYDFGGQQGYLAGQLPYITNVALFILVVEAQYATDEYFETRLERFLVVLFARAPGAVVLLVVSKVDEASGDPELLCRWLEKKVANWLKAKLAARVEDELDRFIDNSLHVQPQALPISVDRPDTIQSLRDEITRLTTLRPPLLRGVGQRIPASYQAVSSLFEAIANLGNDDLVLKAMRDGVTPERGETPTPSSKGSSYRPMDELKALWKRCCQEGISGLRIDDPDVIFKYATALWEAQGVIFVDSGLVYFKPKFVVDVVRTLVDHEFKAEMKDVVAFVKSRKLDNSAIAKLRADLQNFVRFSEIGSWLLLSFLWRDLDLDEKHYSQVVDMLVASGVIFLREKDGENRPAAVVLFRLPSEPDLNDRTSNWPARNANQRELVLKFDLYCGIPSGLVERFVSYVHSFGTSMCCWTNGVILRSVRGPFVCAERVETGIVIKVRFDARQSKNEEAAAWMLLSEAKAFMKSQREERFKGLYYGARLLCDCEKCLRAGIEPEELEWDDQTPNKVSLPCGHIFHIGPDGDGKDDIQSPAAKRRKVPQPTVLIVTTAGTEMDAVLKGLDRPHREEAVDEIPVVIGRLGGRVVAVAKTQQGICRTYGVVLRLLRSGDLRDSVKLVFAVGFAWGAKPAENGGDQEIGDIIVADKLVAAGHVKIQHGKEILRGDIQGASLARSVNDALCRNYRPRVHIGAVISFPKLIDDGGYASYWINHDEVKEHKPIGGEMELYQIADAANETGKLWFLAKGICDFAGLTGSKTKEAQQEAAKAAVDFTKWLLVQDVMNHYLGNVTTA